MAVYGMIGEDSAWFFTCSKGHTKITSPMYDTKKKAEEMEKEHIKRMKCK
jgi:hypothetical protein